MVEQTRGRALIPQNDLWAFNNQELSWIQLATPPEPPARYSQSARNLGSNLYLFGGVDSSNQTLGDLWVFEARTGSWEQLSGGPPARKLHSSVVLESAGKLVIIGGKDGNDTPLSDVWAYDIETGSWDQKAPYHGGEIYDFATAANGNKVYIMGKDNNQMDVYDYLIDKWSVKSVTPAPPARRGAGYTYYEDKAWILGGKDAETDYVLSDTWEYNFETETWEKVADMPMPMEQLVATYLYIKPVCPPRPAKGSGIDKSNVFTFGGFDQFHTLTNTTLVYIPEEGGTLSLTITTTSLPQGQAGSYYQATLTATGGTLPYIWSIISGSLTDGLSLGSTTGIISGTPTQEGTSGFTVSVSDFQGSTTSKSLSIYIRGTPTITFTPTNNDAYAYPNPWKKNDPKQGGRYIYFDKVSEGSTIRIYNIAGKLIDEIPVTDCPQKWDIQSKNIASGVYIYCITGGGGGKMVGKIGIIR